MDNANQDQVQTDDEILTFDDLSDEALEMVANGANALIGVASSPFTYVSGICC